MRGDALPDGAPDHACGGLENYTTYDANSERAYQAMDASLAECANAVIEGLAPSERAAIHHVYLGAVYRFVRGNYHSALSLAKLRIQDRLRARGVWLGD